jgi:hypothetical protein
MKSTGYNWRNTLSAFARTAGVLAGFCITFVALLLGGRTTDTNIGFAIVKFGELAVLLFGSAAALFIAASQLFLQAKEYDVFSIPQEYEDKLKEKCKEDKKEWRVFQEEQTNHCHYRETLGRNFYNGAILMMFIGLWFAIALYNVWVASLAAGLGIALELWQAFRFRAKLD